MERAASVQLDSRLVCGGAGAGNRKVKSDLPSPRSVSLRGAVPVPRTGCVFEDFGVAMRRVVTGARGRGENPNLNSDATGRDTAG